MSKLVTPAQTDQRIRTSRRLLDWFTPHPESLPNDATDAECHEARYNRDALIDALWQPICDDHERWEDAHCFSLIADEGGHR